MTRQKDESGKPFPQPPATRHLYAILEDMNVMAEAPGVFAASMDWQSYELARKLRDHQARSAREWQRYIADIQKTRRKK